MFDRALVLLHRINPDKNEARFYVVQSGPSLLDEHAVLRMWGRIGGYQRSQVIPCASQQEADQLVAQLVKRRLRHGYRITQRAGYDHQGEQGAEPWAEGRS